jgi:hypothetical protein
MSVSVIHKADPRNQQHPVSLIVSLNELNDLAWQCRVHMPMVVQDKGNTVTRKLAIYAGSD